MDNIRTYQEQQINLLRAIEKNNKELLKELKEKIKKGEILRLI